uniref:Uncharacterized protein n=1 Tax=Arundo donax TaxID=35708 RepID=A0A0A9E0K3_ARUDO
MELDRNNRASLEMKPFSSCKQGNSWYLPGSLAKAIFLLLGK